jgi:hypothetical protein
MAIKTFKDLDAWQVGMDLVVRVYEVAKRLPQDERFGMMSQMHRKIRRRYRNHVRIALGSVAELATNVEQGCVSVTGMLRRQRS